MGVTGTTASPAGADSIVYYIRRGQVIKIGTTVDPAGRFTSLMPDEILAFEPGTAEVEKLRHRQFQHLRCQGEHFSAEPELMEHVRELRQTHGDPDPSWPTVASLGVKMPDKKWGYCAQHRQPREQCDPQSRHVWSLRCRDELMGQVAAKAETLGLDRNGGIEAAMEAWVAARGNTKGRKPSAGRTEPPYLPLPTASPPRWSSCVCRWPK